MQERKDLAFTLKDTKTIVGKLETIIAVVLHIIFVMFYLLIFNVSPLSILIGVSHAQHQGSSPVRSRRSLKNSEQALDFASFACSITLQIQTNQSFCCHLTLAMFQT